MKSVSRGNRAAVGMGIPMGMGMGWVWGLKFNPHGSPAWKSYLECEWRVCVSSTDALVIIIIIIIIKVGNFAAISLYL